MTKKFDLTTYVIIKFVLQICAKWPRCSFAVSPYKIINPLRACVEEQGNIYTEEDYNTTHEVVNQLRLSCWTKKS